MSVTTEDIEYLERVFIPKEQCLQKQVDFALLGNEVKLMHDDVRGNTKSITKMMCTQRKMAKCQEDIKTTLDSNNKLLKNYMLRKELLEWTVKNKGKILGVISTLAAIVAAIGAYFGLK